jgi:hypothetical protein
LATSKSTSEIIYNQAERAVSHQVGQLDELRTRAAVILAASGVVTGFLGRAVVEKGVGPFGYFAILLFLLSALACIAVLLPRWESWAFSINAKKLKPYFLAPDDHEQPDTLFEFLADQIQDDYEANQKNLDSLYNRFSLACIFLAAELLVWFLALGLD